MENNINYFSPNHKLLSRYFDNEKKGNDHSNFTIDFSKLDIGQLDMV